MMTLQICDWCGEAPWVYRCSMCDPRKKKAVCAPCAQLWHSRGFSREHVLETREGLARPFAEWFASVNAPATVVVSSPKTVTRPVEVSPTPTDRSTSNDGVILEDAGTASIVLDCGLDVDDHMESELSGVGVSPLDVPFDVDIHTLDTEESNTRATTASLDRDSHTEQMQNEESNTVALSLDDLLRQYPTDNPDILDRLGDYTNAAIKVIDATACVRYNKCTETTCTTLAQHYSHAKSDRMCHDQLCRPIQEFVRHMGSCLLPSCPFCIRVRQRQNVGSVTAYTHLIAIQKRTLKQLSDENSMDAQTIQANRNFCYQQISTCERKKKPHMAEIERLNELVSKHNLPVFNFPSFTWHFQNEPVIKSEPLEQSVTPVQEESGCSAQNNSVLSTQSTLQSATESFDEIVQESEESLNQPVSSMVSSDYIQSLIDTKTTSSEAQEHFDESMELGYAIVDASFCSSSKAPRCLLKCQDILVHLQHHVDLNVCDEHMCRAVEYHFSHLSTCKTMNREDKCEYCLRVLERELVRSVEIMEAEQPEAEAQVQSIINAMTLSFSTRQQQEREKLIIQLEDELDQAEENKRQLLEKLNAQRLKLRQTRKCMEQRQPPIPTAAKIKLPLHFIKTRLSEHTKRRRTHVDD